MMVTAHLEDRGFQVRYGATGLKRLHPGGVLFKDIVLARQFIHLDAWKDREKIIIQSGDANRSRVQRMEIDTTKNKEKVTISGLNGGQSLVIDCAAGKERIVLTDQAGQTFTMDATPGKESVCLRDKAGQAITLRSTPPSVLLKDASAQVIKGLLRHHTIDALRKWEKRIDILDVTFDDSDFQKDHNTIGIAIRYRVIASQVDGNYVYPWKAHRWRAAHPAREHR